MKNEKRRQRGTGSIFRKGPCKLWVIQFYKDGRRIREATGSPDHDAAVKLLRQRLHEIDKHEYVKPQVRRVHVRDLYDALKLDHDTRKKGGRKPDLPGRWKHLEPTFGRMLAGEVFTRDILQYKLARQKAGAADATINRELAALKCMFRFGSKSDPPMVPRVPSIELLKENNVRRGFVEDADFARMAAEADELWLRTFLELGFTYGWRCGELLALRVRQINLALGTIRLDAGTTKNKDGREVAMTARVTELLRESVRGKKAEDLVLTRKGKRPIRDMRIAWRNLCVRAGVSQLVCKKCELAAEPVPAGERRSTGQHGRVYRCPQCGATNRRAFRYRGLIPHDLRRSAAKAARRAGVPESVVMAMGGWRTANMFRRYAIVSSADQRAAVAMLEQARPPALAPFSAPLGGLEPTGGKAAKPN
jgi:integrase